MAPNNGLGRRVPDNFDHVDKYPLIRRAFAPPLITVNRFLKLPNMQTYGALYNQGAEGACVGFGSSWAMTMLNKKAYSARTLYQQAQLVDYWDDTPPEEGTSVSAAMDVLRTQGHWERKYDRKTQRYNVAGPFLSAGITENRWGRTVEDMRACIMNNTPVVIGVNWYADFDRPQWDAKLRRYIIGKDAINLGRIRGGHCVCIRAAVDKWEMFGGVNNWGLAETDANHNVVSGYPLFWIPYQTMARLIAEDGEIAIMTDRTDAKPLQVPGDMVQDV